IGGARTALFNWLFARKRKGKFILRIEDTDALRSRGEYLDEIRESLRWMGFSWDEIYHQSERFALYREHAQKLLDAQKAYVEKTARGEAIIYKVSPRRITVQDEIRGAIPFDTATIKDQVLIKSDGTPAYNFACAVDDAAMGITHVIRGDDHISNTPKQVMLYEALGFTLPRFAHLPLILGMGGGRLSKRTGATAISEYRALGYWPQALVNYLLLLSWSPGDNREIISLEEAASLFDLAAVNKTAATFNVAKLDWINNHYLKHAEAAVLTDTVIPLLQEKGLLAQEGFDRKYVQSLVELFQGRINTLADFVSWADFFFTDDYPVEEKAREKFLSRDLSREFALFARRLMELDPFTVESIETCFRGLVAELGLKTRDLIHPVRVALTGKTVGPGFFDIIFHLGRERTRERLQRFITSKGT
ncbi:MAG: glutamate--tRNA ligase, partial [Candidatus Omnitrophica bacterium]|nr:glutamate--tRNA ligase [Candidatus Omnitrophota bacterium]